MSDLVYHYCTMETFLKIAEKKQLKFSDITKSNDRKEIEYLWNWYIEKMRVEGLVFQSKSLNFFHKQQNESTDYLVACFSEIKDDLHMWSAYGKDGVALGFSKSELTAWSNRLQPLHDGFTFRDDASAEEQNALRPQQGNVTYCDENELWQRFEESIKTYYEDSVFLKFMKISPFIKSKFWQTEKEWRIVLPVSYTDQICNVFSPDKKTETTQKFKLTFEPNSEFGYKTCCFVDFEPPMIKEVVLSPVCRTTVNGIKKIMIAEDFREEDIVISQSEGSLRYPC